MARANACPSVCTCMTILYPSNLCILPTQVERAAMQSALRVGVAVASCMQDTRTLSRSSASLEHCSVPVKLDVDNAENMKQ
jgi:hypothetical protein